MIMKAYTAGLGAFGVEYSGNRRNATYWNSDWGIGGKDYSQFGYSGGLGADFGIMWSRTNTTFIK